MTGLLQVSPPVIGTSGTLQMMVSNLDYDQHKGRLAIGRVTSGSLKKGQTVAMAKPGTFARCLHQSVRAMNGNMSTMLICITASKVPRPACQCLLNVKHRKSDALHPNTV